MLSSHDHIICSMIISFEKEAKEKAVTENLDSCVEKHYVGLLL